MKSTIAIPNFNGENLLRENLPNILASGADEVLVNDDGSNDDSIKILKREFSQVRLLVNQKNLGFIPSVNKLFREALGDIVVLLNSDVFVEKDFLKPLLAHFQDKKVFAVNCHEEGEGWADAYWSNGFFEFRRGEESKKGHRSSWASGGSAAYNRRIWQEMGGFDLIFAPFYWEDVDLSFRAIKAGFEILWEPAAKVKHEHETIIKKTFSAKYTSWVKQRNQLLFIWKNIYDQKLINEHKKNLIKRLLGGVGPGYWIPFLWALSQKKKIKKNEINWKLTDQEVIDYVRR